uniref:Progestin and adipoQ receptor family member 3 n=1 Tax=Rhabditophanes sp. KR3021 TaxID=114890 RepID=A0AC35U671_9BILA
MLKTCRSCRKKPFCQDHNQIKLLSKDKIDSRLWLNEHVHTNYRPQNMSLNLCLRSIFQWNNETINIWSHLIGFLYFSWLQYDSNFNKLATFGASFQDHAIVSISILGYQSCMLFSTLYHIFGCINYDEHKKWLQLDVFGISCALLGVYLGGIYTSFFCFENILKRYLLGLLLICAVALYIPFKRDSLDFKLWENSRVGVLQCAYMAIVAFGVYPTIHWVQLYGGFESPHVQKWTPAILTLYAFLAGAFFFYASLLPERLSVGTFDVVGCSHQWWHLLILIALVKWQAVGLDLLEYYYSSINSCQIAAGDLPFDHFDMKENRNLTAYFGN